MKPILTLSIVFLSGLSAFSQDFLPVTLEVILNNSFKEKRNVQEVQNLPYPIIFIHGLNSDCNVWGDVWVNDKMSTNKIANFLIGTGLTFGGKIDFCLNDDGKNYTSNKNVWTSTINNIPAADITLYSNYNPDLTVADFYFLNFNIDNFGRLPNDPNFIDVLSNESAIVKQGVALKLAIQMVLQKTGKDKVILMGHSMGGLASREYLQNPVNWQSDGNHHVAKLVTTGTPHGGFTGLGLSPSIDFRSEAFRDLKKSYLISGDNSVYLSGGFENYAVMNNNLLYNFYNVDVNCNGVDADNNYVVGLNNKQWRTDLDYSYIVGICTNCGQLQGTIEGDGIVRSENANLSNFTTQLLNPKNEFLYTADASSLIGLHSDLPQAIPLNMQGLDEPNEYSLAYGIELSKSYKGFTTVQPAGGYPYDFDDFTFNLGITSQVSVNITNVSLDNLMAHVLDINGNSYGVISSNGTNSISFSRTLPAGKYYLEIYGTATSTSYLRPYTFTLTNTNLSTDNFELSTPLTVYPNPTKSKVSFDNSISNFEKVSIANSLGQEVSKGSFSTFINNQEVDMSKLPAGVYMLKFSNQKGIKTVKVIKE